MDLRTPLIALLVAASIFLSLTSAPAHAACGDETEAPGCNGPPSGDVGSAPAGHRPSLSVGNPIGLVAGNKRQRETDHAPPGDHLVFRRHYDSANADFDLGIGQGWHHSYAVSLYSAGEDARDIVQSDGRRIRFERVASEDARTVFRAASASDGEVELADGAHRWRLPDGRTLTFQGSYLVRIDWARSAWESHRALALRYRERRLESVTDERGRALRFRWTPGRPGLAGYDAMPFGEQPAHLAALTLPGGGEIRFDYDERRNLTRATYPDGTSRVYHYEDPLHRNHLTGLTERTGTRFASWTYDEAGRAVSAEHADGVERVTLTHHPVDEASGIGRTDVTDSLGAATAYTWYRPTPHGGARLLSGEGPGCATCPPTGYRYAYTEDGKLASITDPLGVVERFAHDDLGRLVRHERERPGEAPVLLERREYADEADATDAEPARVYRPSVRPGAEHVLARVRDDDGRLVAIAERGFAPGEAPGDWRAIERTTRFAYENGRLAAIDGPRDDVDDRLRIERDAAGLPTALHLADGQTFRLLERDARERPTRVRLNAASPWTIRYHPSGEIAELVQRGNRFRYRHDAEGRLLASTDPDGRTTTHERDAAGRLVAMIDDAGRRTATTLDTESRTTLVERFGADGTLVEMSERLFDAERRLAEVSTRRPNPTDGTLAIAAHTVERDADGALVGTPDDLGRELDERGRLVALTDARGNRTVRHLDDFGRLVRLESPDTGTTHHTLDVAGNRIRSVDALGRITRRTFDAANRAVREESPDDVIEWEWHPDNGELVLARNAATVERFGWTTEGELESHARELGGKLWTTRYAYDARGRLERRTLPDGRTLRYHYHEAGDAASGTPGTLRAITVERLFGLAQETLVGEIDLDPRDGTSGHVAANGVRTTRTHAADGSPTRIELGTTLGLDYRHDAAGRIVGIDENGLRQRFVYAGHRLALADTLGGLHLYTHDALGNRTSTRTATPDGEFETTRHEYAAPGTGNRLVAEVDGPQIHVHGVEAVGGTGVDVDLVWRDTVGAENGRRTAERPRRYVHDAVGNPIERPGGLRYAYDARNRPVRVLEDGRTIAEYAYNPFGERVRKTVHTPDGGTRTTLFLYEEEALAAEIDPARGTLRQHVRLDGHPVALLDGDTVFAVHTDHLGAPRFLTDARGRPVWQARLSPFGEATVAAGSIDYALRLPGQYHDAETGTHYSYLRDVDPALGRFLTADPLGLAAGPNAYAYVDGDPLSFVDPLGLFSDAGLRRFIQDTGLDRQVRVQSTGSVVTVPHPSGGANGVSARTMRVISLMGLLGRVTSYGYNGAQLYDQLVVRPAQRDDLVAEIGRYVPGYQAPSEDLSADAIDALIQRLRREQEAYSAAWAGMCPYFEEDVELLRDTRAATGEAYRDLTGFTSPEGFPFASEAAYELAEREYRRYLANGGRLGFGDWLVRYRYGGEGDQTRPRSDLEPVSRDGDEGNGDDSLNSDDGAIGDSAEAPSTSESAVDIPANPPNIEDFDDPDSLPEGWEWRGNGPPGSRRGAYHNPNTGESLHDDRTHPAGKDPHVTYTDADGVRWDNYGAGWIEQTR